MKYYFYFFLLFFGCTAREQSQQDTTVNVNSAPRRPQLDFKKDKYLYQSGDTLHLVISFPAEVYNRYSLVSIEAYHHPLHIEDNTAIMNVIADCEPEPGMELPTQNTLTKEIRFDVTYLDKAKKDSLYYMETVSYEVDCSGNLH